MILFNNRYISNYRIIFFLVDSILILCAVVIGYYLRFWWKGYPIILQYSLGRGLFFAFIFQLSLYYFELYDLKIIRDSSKFSLRFIQSVAATLTVLMIAYYILPVLYSGRAVLLFTVPCASAGIFFWRIIYRNFVKGKQLNERILILGTGEFAREIARQIRDKGDSGFDVIGHIIDEKAKESET